MPADRDAAGAIRSRRGRGGLRAASPRQHPQRRPHRLRPRRHAVRDHRRRRQRDDAQDPDALAGKILRLTPDGDVPADNPVAGNPMYSMGPPQSAGHRLGRRRADVGGRVRPEHLGRAEPHRGRARTTAGPRSRASRRRADGFVDPVQQWPTDEASPSGIADRRRHASSSPTCGGERLRAVDRRRPAESTELLRPASTVGCATSWSPPTVARSLDPDQQHRRPRGARGRGRRSRCLLTR